MGKPAPRYFSQICGSLDGSTTSLAVARSADVPRAKRKGYERRTRVKLFVFLCALAKTAPWLRHSGAQLCGKKLWGRSPRPKLIRDMGAAPPACPSAGSPSRSHPQHPGVRGEGVFGAPAPMSWILFAQGDLPRLNLPWGDRGWPPSGLSTAHPDMWVLWYWTIVDRQLRCSQSRSKRA